jgi:hypothetical protein
MSNPTDLISAFEGLVVRLVLAVLVLTGAVKVIALEIRSVIRLIIRRRLPAGRRNHGKSG